VVSAPKEIQDILENEEDVQGNFALLPEDLYLCKLKKATEYEPGKDKEYGGVNLQWEVVQPREFRGKDEDGNQYGDLFLRLSWSPKAAWKIREFWDALGYEYDSDFDEPVEQGEQAILSVTQSLVPYGKRKGQMSNNVDEVLEATAEAIAALPA